MMEQVEKKKQKKSGKYFWNIVLVFAIAITVGYFSLRDDFSLVINALKAADIRYIGIILALIFIYFAIDGLIFYVFARLYTTRYRFHRGLAVAFIGSFYNAVTPSSSGGQFMQAVTFKKQQVDVSTAASILVMHFIVYQIVLMIWGIVAIIFKFETLMVNTQPIPIFDIQFPVWLLSLIGFTVNAAVITGLLVMSYSKKIHHFIINSGVTLASRLKLVRDPEKTRSRLKISTENFRIELRRLQSNIPVTILITLLFSLRFLIIYSIPFMVGKTLGVPMIDMVTGDSNYWDSVFMASFLQMITSLVPIPGAAGFSEFFFERLFTTIFVTVASTKASQLLWRFFTFYFGLIAGGFVAALYKTSMEEEIFKTEHKTFVDLQADTYEVRKKTSDSMYNTNTLSVREIEARIKRLRGDVFAKKQSKTDIHIDDGSDRP